MRFISGNKVYEVIGIRYKKDNTVYEATEVKTAAGKVWPDTVTVTYALVSVSVDYGNLNYLHPDADNYAAYIKGTLITYYNGVEHSRASVTLTPLNYQSSNLITLDGVAIKWNEQTYGTTTRAATSVAMKGTYTAGDQTFTEDVTVSLGANAIESRSLVSRTLTLGREYEAIPCTATSFRLFPELSNRYLATWTSGRQSDVYDDEGNISIYVNGTLKTSTAGSGIYKSISVLSNKYSLVEKTYTCYAKIGDTESASISVEHEPDTQTTSSVIGQYSISANPISNTISAGGGSARYEISAAHEVITTKYWGSDGSIAEGPTTSYEADDWGYNLTAGSEDYFTPSASGVYFNLSHQNMLKRVTTDTVSYEFYNASSPTVKTSAYMFDATNAITNSTYRVSLAVASTTVSALEQTIDITSALHITDNTYTSGATDTVAEAGNSELSLIGTGFTFWDSKTRVHVTKNTGSSSREARLTLHWSEHSLSQAITLTQEAAIVPITFTVTPTSKTIDYREQGILYTVVAQGAWTATPNKDWLHGGSGEGSLQIAFFVDENTGNTIRTGTLTFVCGTESVTVTVIQTRNMSV